MHHFTVIMRKYEVIFSNNLSARPSVACFEETNARWRMRLGFHPPACGRPEACVFVTQISLEQRTQGFIQCLTRFENKFSKLCIPLLGSRRMQDSTPNSVSNKVMFLTKISLRKTTLAKADLVNVSKELNSVYFINFM